MDRSKGRIRSLLDRDQIKHLYSQRNPIIEVCGEKRVFIEFHRGIDEYAHDSIRIRVQYGTIHIEGESLHICKMGSEQLLICGKIDHIHLMRRRSV